ncbi:S8 family peptidase [Spirosoma linguale]|uniref:Peptidase S8 and S53 subtilisin kexin sedolisin n=1 Tax=Spirosoma linguale (strain ATCC 33905 / DSM 74 / LMG 10896 / Claus 1) TaxID=504472 RepID=D2QJ85_SPILD|nr:peptidase S8 and S53 subtilisin kexin sedolisin [Spirosoma linguale DSM 74]
MKPALITFAVTSLCLLAIRSHAQNQPDQWHHLDPTTDKLIGISTQQAYQLLSNLPHKPTQPIIVAVIDGGIDTNHDDLKAILWHNPKEIADNHKDDDGNGYTDDVFGWNFMGNPDGRNYVHDQKEETRLYARLKPLYEGKNRENLPPRQLADYTLWARVKPYFERKRAEAQTNYRQDSLYLAEDLANVQTLKKAFGVSRLDSALLHSPPTTDTTLHKLAGRYYRGLTQMKLGTTDSLLARYTRYNAELKARVDYAYNLEANERALVGDKAGEFSQRHYGNANLTSPLDGHGTFHGSHVAGIIAADRTNKLGVNGIADQVRILSVRCIPDGDERDKDVANAIRYAVDNGAQIINMSFGKYFSPDKALVDEAMRYADKKGVLLVHAAGNDHLNLDSTMEYPSPMYLNSQPIANLITVGASGRTDDSSLVAGFSNYSSSMVDVFAPGFDIWSCGPANTYRPASGTSMATPMVAGIAAVLKTYFPGLRAADLKRIILQSAVVYHTPVLKPGTKQKVDFASLSKTGAIVNLYEAVKLALSEAQKNKGMTRRRLQAKFDKY